MSYPEKPRSNWWYILPILFGLIGGVIAYFVLRKDDSIKAKTCVCVSLTVWLPGFIGGIISYFILRKENPSRAKLFIYLGIIFGVAGILLNILIGPSIPGLDSGFDVNI